MAKPSAWGERGNEDRVTRWCAAPRSLGPEKEKKQQKQKERRSADGASPRRVARPPVSQSGRGARKARADTPQGQPRTRPPTTTRQPCGARPSWPRGRRRRRRGTRYRGTARESQHVRLPRRGVDRGRPKPHRIACAHEPGRGSSHSRDLADCRTCLYDTEGGRWGSRGSGSCLCHTESRSVQGAWTGNGPGNGMFGERLPKRCAVPVRVLTAIVDALQRLATGG